MTGTVSNEQIYEVLLDLKHDMGALGSRADAVAAELARHDAQDRFYYSQIGEIRSLLGQRDGRLEKVEGILDEHLEQEKSVARTVDSLKTNADKQSGALKVVGTIAAAGTSMAGYLIGKYFR